MRGTYGVDSDTYSEESNDAVCTDVPKSFKYTFDGTNLKFNYIDDPAKATFGGGARMDRHLLGYWQHFPRLALKVFSEKRVNQ